MLTVAIPKGALLPDAIALLQSVGLDFSLFQDPSNRLLQITDPTDTACALLVRSQDVPVYVEYGQAQLGIVGDDVLREKKAKVANLVDLGFGQCRMSIAVPKHSPYQSALELPPHCRVASKYVHCARDYFQSIDLPVEIIPLYGSVELAIVDLVSTGRTLRDNGLIETDILFQSTAHLIAHPLSYRLNRDRLTDWVEKLRPVVIE
jgi:ATP phosphoribosyltransferase